MKVRDVMTTEIITISPQATYEDVARLIWEHRHSGFPVVDDEGVIVGVLSEKNLFRGLYPKYEDFMSSPEEYFFTQESREERLKDLRHRPIVHFMNKDVVSIHPDAPIMRAGGIMLARNFYRLPVVEHDTLIGMVTRKNIFGQILQYQLDL